jgi:hypothetical protein
MELNRSFPPIRRTVGDYRRIPEYAMRPLGLKARHVEALLYTVLWLLVFSLPFYGERVQDEIHWGKLLNDWLNLSFLLMLFLVNVYYLVPTYLFTKRYARYFLLTAVASLLAIALGNMLVPAALRYVPGTRAVLPEVPLHSSPVPMRKPLPLRVADDVILALLIVGAGTASRLAAQWLAEETLRKDLEKEQLKTSLALLRHQVSPHFLMNTLNNIHALIDINPESAQDAIVRLSTLMRYLLYDSARSAISLRKEIEFLRSFITLMQLRFADAVEITVDVPHTIPDIEIPPMLLISFLENAFTHGVSRNAPSFIHLELRIESDMMQCTVRNSKHGSVERRMEEYSGLGLENVKKSLALLYDDSYSLQVNDAADEYEVRLKVPL